MYHNLETAYSSVNTILKIHYNNTRLQSDLGLVHRGLTQFWVKYDSIDSELGHFYPDWWPNWPNSESFLPRIGVDPDGQTPGFECIVKE